MGQLLELIELNHSNGTNDHVVVVVSDWTTDGSAPPSLQPAVPQELDVSASQGKMTKRSTNQSASYQADRGVFRNEIKAYLVCNNPLHCKLEARDGVSCWTHKGHHHETDYNLASRWRKAVEQEGGSVRHLSKSIRRAIKDDLI